MGVYPIIQDPPPWNNPQELGTEVVVSGRTIIAVVSTDPVVGDIGLGGAGFEATAPYVLCHRPDLDGLTLHGATVTIDGVDYRVRNVSDKDNINLTRLWLRNA